MQASTRADSARSPRRWALLISSAARAATTAVPEVCPRAPHPAARVLRSPIPHMTMPSSPMPSMSGATSSSLVPTFTPTMCGESFTSRMIGFT